jgi:hypothetical protein
MSFILFLFPASLVMAGNGEAKAVERLSITTDMLITVGEEMADPPVIGMLVLEDTVTIDMKVDPVNSYEFIIWTDSAFNRIDFWLTNPLGETPRVDFSDHTTFAILPDSTEAGVWQMHMELFEGAHGDTAYFAAATFTRVRALK